jgi:hypothetical protein
VLQELKLVVEVVDGAVAAAFGPPAERAGYQHHNPQYDYEDQQDHNRHSPTTYLRSVEKANQQPIRNGGWWG